jgi:RNA polymerase sigma-70 factor (ECF subfamily)
MTASLPRELRAARLRALSGLAAHLGDITAARAAVDGVLGTPDRGAEDWEPDALLARAWEAAGQGRPAGLVAQDDTTDVLRLLSACAHRSLPEAARIALVLSVAAGMSTDDVGKAFAAHESVMAQRLAWAEARVRPVLADPIAEQDVPEQLGRVLDVLMLIFDDGVVHPHAQVDLPWEAVETTRVLVELFHGEQEPRALLALMLLTRARRDARQEPDGTLRALEVQNRDLWHHAEIEEGLFLLRGSQRRGRTGPYQVRASIQAAHVTAHEASDTDWPRLLTLYDRLMEIAPSDAVALGRACAVAEVTGPEAALESVERMGLDTHLYHATRAELLRRMGRADEADRAWTAAVARVRSAAEHQRMRGALER